MRWLLALASLSLTQVAYADAKLLAQVDADVARGQAGRAQRRLLAALTKAPRDFALLARYAELALPCEGAPTREGTRELPRRIARAEQTASDARSVPDAEAERRVYLHAALAAALRGELAEGLMALRGASRRQDPLSAQCARSIAATAIAQEHLDVALEALRLASEVLPQEPAIRGELARVSLAVGRVDVALPLFAQRYAEAPAELGARQDLAYALAADGRPREGVALLAGSDCREQPACAPVAARIALDAGDLVSARSYLEAQLARGEDLDALYALADVHTRARRLDDARATYQRILKLRPESVRANQALRALDGP